MYMCVYVCVCMYVFMYICVYVCMCVYMYLCTYYACMYLCIFVRVYICMYVCKHFLWDRWFSDTISRRGPMYVMISCKSSIQCGHVGHNTSFLEGFL